MSSAEPAIAAKRVRDDLAYARFSWFHVQVRGEMEKKGEEEAEAAARNEEQSSQLISTPEGTAVDRGSHLSVPQRASVSGARAPSIAI